MTDKKVKAKVVKKVLKEEDFADYGDFIKAKKELESKQK